MYITNFNLYRVLQDVNINIQKTLDDKDLIKVLSNSEIELLEKSKEFFKNNDVHTKTLHPVEVVDNYKLLNEGLKPAYHLNSSCERLNAKYVNYYIPNEIQKGGVEAVKKFRHFIKSFLDESKSLSDKDVILAIKAKYEFADDNFGKIEKDNGGITDFAKQIQNLSEEDLFLQSLEIQNKLTNFSSQSQLHRQVYNLRYREPRDIKNLLINKSQEMRIIAEEFATLKQKLLLVLIEKFKKESGFNQNSLEVELLKRLGFVPCKHCVRI